MVRKHLKFRKKTFNTSLNSGCQNTKKLGRNDLKAVKTQFLTA